jgi:hypothetical protein
MKADLDSAQEQLTEASGAMDSIVREVESLEKDYTKQNVYPISARLILESPRESPSRNGS